MSQAKHSSHSKQSRPGPGCLIGAGLLLIIFIAALIAVGLGLSTLWTTGQTTAELPGLEDDTSPEAVQARREEALARLNSYGWIDEEVGQVRLPIEQAMAVIAERGLPVGQEGIETPTPTPPPQVEAEATPAEATPMAAEETQAETPPPAQTGQVTAETATPTPEPSPTVDLANVSFQEHVLPILQEHCNECHGQEEPEEGLRLTGFEEVMAGSWNGSVIEPGNVEDSYLIEQIVAGRMPKRGPNVPPDQIDIITAWVEAGAPDN